MKIDNFELFEKYILDFGPDIGDPNIYQVEIIERKKDGVKTSGANNSSRRVASYFIESKAQWDKMKPRIKDLADSRPGVRVYINPNKKKASRCLKQLNLDLAERNIHDAYTGISKILDTAIAKTTPNKKGGSVWILDIDPDDSFWDRKEEIEDLLKNDTIVILPSKSGEHILTRPFNREEFKKDFTERFGVWKEDIIKINSLTNLYYNDEGV